MRRRRPPLSRCAPSIVLTQSSTTWRIPVYPASRAQQCDRFDCRTGEFGCGIKSQTNYVGICGFRRRRSVPIVGVLGQSSTMDGLSHQGTGRRTKRLCCPTAWCRSVTRPGASSTTTLEILSQQMTTNLRKTSARSRTALNMTPLVLSGRSGITP